MSSQTFTTAGPRAEWSRALPLMLIIMLIWLLELAGRGSPPQFPMVRYLALHTLFEVVALVLAAVSFALLWLAPQSARRTGAVVLAATLAGSAALDFLHLLSYEGMPPLVTDSGVEKGIAFWLAGRLLLSMGMLGAAFLPQAGLLPGRRRYVLLAAALGAAALPSWFILFHPQQLPRTFAPGQGLTGFKVGAELLLIALLLATAVQAQRLARRHGSAPAAALSIAAALSAMGEACFASYASASDLLNLLGHLAKIGAYSYLTRGAYLLAIRQPLEALGGVADALTATLNPALICSPNGTVRWVNPAFVRATGRPAEDWLGHALAQLRVDGDDAPWAAMQAAMRAGQAWHGQAQVQRSDGSRYTDHRRLTPMHGPQGQLSGFVLIGDDLTERERTARELRAGEERLRALLECAPDAIVVIDRRGRVQMANPAVEQMFGYRREEVLGSNISLLMPPAEAGEHDGHLQRYAESRVPHIIGVGRDMQARRKDGSLLHVHLTIGEVHLPDGVAYIGFMRDISERIQAAAALAEREERYRALMDTAIDGVWISDAQGRVLAVNDAYCRRSGYSRDELLRMRIADIEAEESSGDVAAHIERIVAQGHDKFETHHRDKSGLVWPVEITASYAARGGGQFFVFARDLTQQRATALALRQSEERFALALRGTNDGLWDVDLLNDTIYLSPRWKEMLGFDAGAPLNRYAVMTELLHPADALAAQLAIGDFAAGRAGERLELEMRLRHRDGHWVHVLSRGQMVRDAAGRPVRLIGTHQDLTERKRAEAALRESEDKLRNLFALSPLGIALCTLDGRLVDFNEAYRALTGHSAEALRHLSYWDVTPADYARAEAIQLETVTRTGRYGPYEKEYLRADGSRVPVRLNGVRIDIDGRPHLWSIVEDLTEPRRVEAERQALQRQQLQSQKLEALGHLTGGIAHDFNNMLAGIMGLASLGLDRFVSEPEGKLAQYLREIVRTSERGRDLVAKMLAYVRTEEPANVTPRQLAPMVDEMCEMLRSSIPSSIALRCACDEGLPAVRMSAVDLQQIVMNLVINARDAIGPQGHIDVRLRSGVPTDATCASCHEHIAGDCVVLEVVDDGCGIPPEALTRIFDPFFTTKSVGKGTGLGLSSVIGLVHKAGGHMQVQDRAPRGTLMRVWLPAAAELAAPPAEPARAPVPQARAPLWVVDDDPAVLVFLTELLRENGFRVDAFSDPRQALRALGAALGGDAATARPAALITDQTMPGMTGAELARAAMALLPDLPVILCTGYSELVDAESAQAMGVRHFLRKPFDSSDLMAALDEVLQAG